MMAASLSSPLAELRKPVAPPWHPWSDVATWKAALVLVGLLPICLLAIACVEIEVHIRER